MSGYEKIVCWEWKHKYKNEGTPPESVLEHRCNKYISSYHTKDAIHGRFNLQIKPVGLVLGKGFERFGNLDEYNESVALDLYEGIIYKRIYLLKRMQKKRNRFGRKDKKGPFKSVVNLITLYKSTIFYDDDILMSKINDLRDLIVRQPTRSQDVVAKRIEDMEKYLAEDKRYFLEYGNKRKI
jgi:hypothetical protein